METIVWWSAGGGKVEIKKLHGDDCLVERRGGGKFKYRSFMETIVWWSTEGGEKFKSISFMETIVWWSAGGGEVQGK